MVAALQTQRAERIAPASPEDVATVRLMLKPEWDPAFAALCEIVGDLLDAFGDPRAPWTEERITDAEQHIERVRRVLDGRPS